MKNFPLIIIFVAFSSPSLAIPMSQAWTNVMQEMGPALQSMEIQWRHFLLQDEDSCRYIHETNSYWMDVFTTLDGDLEYANLKYDLHNAGVPWNDFMENYVKPAFGYFPYDTHTCSGNDGGRQNMMSRVRAAFDARRSFIQTAINTARAASPEYEAIHQRVAANQQAGTNVRCNAYTLQLDQHMTASSFELNFFLNIFNMIISLYIPSSCN